MSDADRDDLADLEAPPRARCDGCGRVTWDDALECRMPQPDGEACPGKFQPIEQAARVERRTFPIVRDVAAAIARAAIAVLEVEVLEQAIAEGERALSVGPIVDPTLARDAGPELERHVELLRATLTYRQALERFKPQTGATQ